MILLARGGGSLEDLWAFNDEALARAIAASPVPVVSAVGHETDFTLADFAADVRAPTPSVAAELLVPDRDELRRRVATLQARLHRQQRQQLRQAMQRADRAGLRLEAQRPRARLDLLCRRQADSLRRLGAAWQRRLEREQSRLRGLARSLETVSPLATVARGYALLQHEDGRLIRSTAQADVGDRVEARLADGTLKLVVR